MKLVHTHMEDGRALCLRPLKEDDEPLIEAGIKALSDHSRYLRFFSGFKQVPQTVLDQLTDFGDDHIAWGAVDNSLSSQPPIAAAHLVGTDDKPSDRGEYAIAVLDDYHNQGVARLLTYHLFRNAIVKGFTTADLDVLTENVSGIAFFKWLEGRAVGQSSTVIHMELDIKNAIERLERWCEKRERNTKTQSE